MHINIRRFLALSFVAIFFILLPMILNYSRGYRFDTNKNEMVRTGGISISSTPKNAQVFLNGNYEEPNMFEKLLLPLKNIFEIRKMGGTTPAIFQNLLPDEYKIEVTKDGYHPWRKTIEVYAEQVVFAENINLFLETPQADSIIPSNIINQEFSPNQEKLAYTIKNNDKWEFRILTLENSSDKLMYKSSYEIEHISWALDSSNLYLKIANPDSYVFINPSSSDIAYLENFRLQNSLTSLQDFDLSLANLRWSISDPNILFVQNENKIYTIDVEEQSLETLHTFSYQTTDSVADFFVKDGSLWIIQLYSENAELKRFQPQSILSENGAEKSQTIAILPRSNQYRFSDYTNSLITIQNTQTKNIFVINPDAKRKENIIVTKFFADQFIWNNAQDKILYWDDFEIGIAYLYIDDENSYNHHEILSRYSERITQAHWSTDENYIFLSLRDALYALELDNRDKRNITLLTSADTIKSFSLQNKNIIYLVGQINDIAGIHKLSIQ